MKMFEDGSLELWPRNTVALLFLQITKGNCEQDSNTENNEVTLA
jgi:hypothetical protein